MRSWAESGLNLGGIVLVEHRMPSSASFDAVLQHFA
jgi:hypothetical protein